MICILNYYSIKKWNPVICKYWSRMHWNFPWNYHHKRKAVSLGSKLHRLWVSNLWSQKKKFQVYSHLFLPVSFPLCNSHTHTQKATKQKPLLNYPKTSDRERGEEKTSSTVGSRALRGSRTRSQVQTLRFTSYVHFCFIKLCKWFNSDWTDPAQRQVWKPRASRSTGCHLVTPERGQRGAGWNWELFWTLDVLLPDPACPRRCLHWRASRGTAGRRSAARTPEVDFINNIPSRAIKRINIIHKERHRFLPENRAQDFSL